MHIVQQMSQARTIHVPARKPTIIIKLQHQRPSFMSLAQNIGCARFALEFVREPDVQLGILPWGLSMGQTLSAPMILAGIYFIATANNRPVVIAPPEPDGKPA